MGLLKGLINALTGGLSDAEGARIVDLALRTAGIDPDSEEAYLKLPNGSLVKYSQKDLGGGDPKHDHRYDIWLEWDPLLGKEVRDFGNHYATFCNLQQCRCGERRIGYHRALY